MRGTHGAPWGGKTGESASQCAPEIVGGIAMAAGKSWTAQPQNLLDGGERHASRQQRARYPQIGDAPVGLGKSLHDVPAPHPSLVDLCGLRSGQARWRSRWPRRRDGLRTGMRCVAASAELLTSGLQKAFGVARQTRRGIHDFHPRRIAVAKAAVGLLVGEAGKSAQMPPIGTGAVAAIEMGQVSAHGGSEGRIQWRGTDLHPSLPMARTGLEHNARFMPVGPHHRQRRRIGVIHVDQDIASVAVLSIGVDVYVASLAIAGSKKADGRQVCQLSGSPQPFSGERPFGQIVDQTDEVKFAGHGRELAADGLRGEREAEVEHTPNSEIELGCRTMNWQRVVNSVLTDCLSQGAHPMMPLRSWTA